MTTLTTVGYGDYAPFNYTEILVDLIFMFMGVVVFSYIMSSVINIIEKENEKMSSLNQSRDLKRWLTLLTRFTKNKTLSKSLSHEIIS
jgi:hypothetical protein